MPRKSNSMVDWGAWVRSFGAAGLAFLGVLIAFYFTTKDTLNRHEAEFVNIGKKFDGFSNILQKNYDDWAKQNRADQEKADKVREQFLTQFTQWGINNAALKVQVENTAKQLDAVINKLDMIQDVQRQNRRPQQ